MRKKVVTVISALVAIAVLAVAFTGCTAVVDGIDVSGYVGVQYTSYDYFNTYVTVACYIPEDRKQEFETLWNTGILPLCEEVENTLSSDVPASDVARFNSAEAGQTVQISQMTYDVLSLAKTAYEETDGAYNPALANSVDLWGFSSRFNYEDGDKHSMPYDREDHKTQLPSQEYVDAFLSLCDFSKTSLQKTEEGCFVTKSDAVAIVEGVEYTQKLDLGGIGKGYCADEIGHLMTRNGFLFGYVNIGGSSMRMLKNVKNGGYWSTSVLSPREQGKFYFKVNLKDNGLSTSGDYQRYYEIDGTRYSHIIDPFTGMPYQSDIITASVYGPDSALCDAYSTALCVMGTQKASQFLQSIQKQGYTYSYVAQQDGKLHTYYNANGKAV